MIFDLTWNWVIHTFIILAATSFGYNMAIFHAMLGYFKMIDQILSNFYGFKILVNMNFDQYNWYEYQSNIMIIFVIKLQCIILTDKKNK